jgi:hypothetical protein
MREGLAGQQRERSPCVTILGGPGGGKDRRRAAAHFTLKDRPASLYQT